MAATATRQSTPTPFEIEERLAEVRTHLMAGALDAAEAALDRLLAAAPETAIAHALRGTLRGMQGRLAEAFDAYAAALTLDSGLDPVRFDQANALLALGRREEALGAIEQVIAGGYAFVLPSQRLRVRLLVELGRREEAEAAVDAALRQFPRDAELRAWRGTVRRLQKRCDEALAIQETVLAELPDFLPALCEKGWCLLQLGRAEAALDAFDAALERDENLISALTGMGIAERQVGLDAAALAAFDKALSLDPTDLEALFNRALTLHLTRRFDAALAAYDELVRHWPETAEAYDNIGDIHRVTGALDEAEKAFRRALEIKPDDPRIHSNLLLSLLYQPERTAESLTAEHAAWGRRFGRPAGRFTSWDNDRDPDRPLRIGILSAELRRHPVSSWLIPALEAIDHRSFSVVCYAAMSRATSTGKDEVSTRIESLVDGWREVDALSDQALAELIRADRIDILIELSGHTAHNRLPCLARKPAPVQVSWLGYPFTTGLDAIDHCLMDDVAVRPGEEEAFVESIWRLEGGRCCYEPPVNAPPVVQPPVMRHGWVTFGSFNNITKLSPEVIATWCRVLRAVPTARFVVKSPALAAPEVARRFRADFAAHGVSEARLDLRGGSSYERMLAAYGDIDIALDPFPFGGGATSCEALWMGLPIVTLPRWQPASRQTEAFLRAMGHDDWVARDVDDYVGIAADLARDPLRLYDWRSGQRERMLASPLCDKARIARELQLALRGMWRRFVATPQA